ncbi:MAG TPA: universal stress protein [Casimicrobiaceae bacterium]|nr:universal stress protein [Casimicrobiaceae bacterium]
MPKILFAVDGSEASLRAARGLAGILSWWKATDVEVLNVQPESFIFSELVPLSQRERAESRVREEGERALAMAHAVLQGAAAECATTVRFGDAATAIAHAAEMLDCAMIAMGSRGAGAVGSLVTGSVTTKVIHIGFRPVLVVPSARPQAGSAYGPTHRAARVLVPVDRSAGATAALKEVLRIASWFRNAPEIHLLAVYEGSPLDVEIAAMTSAEALHEHQQERFEAALLPARDALSGTAFEAIEHTAIGPPAEKIRATIETHLFDLVCLGTRGMGAVRNLILGSTAAKVLRAVDVPILVVPPAAP